jgi:hypothetical protein
LRPGRVCGDTGRLAPFAHENIGLAALPARYFGIAPVLAVEIDRHFRVKRLRLISRA